ncbi:uncharacterized protein C12orf54 homolog isoform X3 [Monodelphis domestica]|uniref:uncharacterized protein C12orf54 homolog isoform X3 n=2 Tax=Monodelphis domestica TaxID=13616 RepID=UPI0004435882|nr:uncharacterized protein C12orf54 homolog isoform X3 [Monodelphis domestica]
MDLQSPFSKKGLMAEQTSQGTGEPPNVNKSNLQDHVEKIMLQYHEEVQIRDEIEEQLCLKIKELEEKVKAQDTQLMMARTQWLQVLAIFKKLQKELQEDARIRAEERKREQRYENLFHEIQVISTQTWKPQVSRLEDQSKGNNIVEPSLRLLCPLPEGLSPRSNLIPRNLGLHSGEHASSAPVPPTGLIRLYSQGLVPWNAGPPVTAMIKKKTKALQAIAPTRSSDTLLSSGGGEAMVWISQQKTPLLLGKTPAEAGSSGLGIRLGHPNLPPPEAVQEITH